jgi:hypothetical protein
MKPITTSAQLRFDFLRNSNKNVRDGPCGTQVLGVVGKVATASLASMVLNLRFMKSPVEIQIAAGPRPGSAASDFRMQHGG